ncbi:MAG: ABC transporter substrate-binding protein, partial [Desulfurococcales archaeon]|nr:ABC transporter substrate-binding protein [Desulfurococcales archaeon]
MHGYRGASRLVFAAAVALVIIVILVAAFVATRPSPPPVEEEEEKTTTTPVVEATPTPTATATTPQPTPAEEEKTIVIYASLSEMTTADPSTEFSNSIIWMPLVYEPLVWYDPLEDRLIPGLAVEWESSDNGTVWTFRLRSNAKFHDGTPVTAEAVKSSIERTIALGQGAAFIWDPVESIEVVDEYTIRFNLK